MTPRLMEFGSDIWVCQGPTVPFLAGFSYPTRMVVIRLADGGLFIWSPVALTPELGAEIDRLGPVRHLVSPNKIHHLFMGEWESAWPEASLHASPGLERKRRDLDFDATLGNVPDPAWAGVVDQVCVSGSVIMSEIVFFHHESRTVIFADLIENFPRDWFTGWRGWLARLDGIVAPSPGAPREWRWSFLRRREARAALARILDWPIENVIMAHGTLVRGDGKSFVETAFHWLGRKKESDPRAVRA